MKMGLDLLVLVGLCLSPFEFFHVLIFHRKKVGLLEDFLTQGEDVQGSVASRKSTQRRYGRFRQVHTTIQYSYTLANGETYKKFVTLKSTHLPKSTTTIALKVLPEQYPELACPVVFLKEQLRDLNSKCHVACRLVFALVGVSIASLLLFLMIRGIVGNRHTTMLKFWTSYMVVLAFYTSLGYPCAWMEYRRWKHSVLLQDDYVASSTSQGAEYQLVKQSEKKTIDTSSTPRRNSVRIQEVAGDSLSLDIGGEESDGEGKSHSSYTGGNVGVLL